MADVDVAIIGGGPAGQAAALQLAGTGLSLAVFDEQLRPGGQILRQPPAGFAVSGWMAGRGYAGPRARLADFEALDADGHGSVTPAQAGAHHRNAPAKGPRLRGGDGELEHERSAAKIWRGGRSVLGIARDGDGFMVTAIGPDGREAVAARRVLVAAGCQDVAVPLPGWTLPGVMAAGGLQAFVKAQRIVPGSPVVLVGTHPLMLLIAEQIMAGGGTVAAVLFAQGRSVFAGAVAGRPGAAIGGAANLLAAAAAWRRLRTGGVPVRFGAGVTAIAGGARTEAVVLADGERIACDTVGLCFGFVPQSELVRAAGVAVRVAGPAGGWAALHDDWMETRVRGLFVAGETTGVAGAPAVAVGGAIAGVGIARSLGLDGANADQPVTRAKAGAHHPNVQAMGPRLRGGDEDIDALRREHRRLLGFAALLDAVADPRGYRPVADAETIVCRCEDVRLREIAAAVALVGTANAVKLATRCGMGLCQGRNCEPSLLRLLPAGDPGFAARFPARPVAIGDLLWRQ